MIKFSQFINEAVCKPTIEAGADTTANNIVGYLQQNYNINWKVQSVSAAIANVTGEDYISNYLDKDITSKYDKIYKLSCLNGGTSITKDSEHSLAEIVSHKNNTDVKWFACVSHNTCDMYIYTRGNYGVGEGLNKSITFNIR